jgi:hypothetical protein
MGMKTTRKRYSAEFKAKVAMEGMASLFDGGDQGRPRLPARPKSPGSSSRPAG